MKFIAFVARPLDNVARKINAVIEASITMALVGILSVLIVTVMSRYFFRIAAPWILEFVGYATAFIGAFGFSCLVRRRTLLAITFLREKLPLKAKKIFGIVIWGLLIFYFRIIVEHGFAFAISAAGRFSDSLVFPLEYVRMILPVGGLLIVFQAANNILQDLLELTSVSEKGTGENQQES